MSKKYTLHILPEAYGKLVEHVDFLAQVSVPASERLYDDIIKCLEIIALDPECYARYNRLTPINVTLRYTLCYKLRYRIVFGVIDDTVYVYDIQDCRQNTDKHLI